ncbi:zf-CCHC domain-containing protein [Tanacetum coccineum]
MSSITRCNFCDKKMPTTEIRRHELQCEKKLQENTGYGVRTDALSFGGSILKKAAEEAKKEPGKATKEDAVATIKKSASTTTTQRATTTTEGGIGVLYKVEDIATYLVEYVKFWDDWGVDRYGNANLGTSIRRIQDLLYTKLLEDIKGGPYSKKAQYAVNEKVYAAQVGCEQCKGPHYTKDCPLKEEGKTLEEAYYTQFGGPFQGGGYRAAAPGYYQRNNANPLYQEQRHSMEYTLSKFMSESAKRHEENSNLIKEIRAATDAAIRNQGASIKTLEIQISQMSKELVSVMPLLTYLNLGLGELAHTKLTIELADRTMKYPKEIAKNVLVRIDHLSTARAKIDVYKRKITLRVGEEKIVFTSVKSASSLIKRVYMLSLRERMELDLEARLMGETLVLNRSLDPLLEDYIELNDLNKPIELRRNLGDDLMPTIKELKDNKIDLLVQQYEQFTILEEESIDSGFARFNTIITSLKALDEGFSSKNYVRKFLRALHPKWRAKVTAIEESKDLSSLALDELIGNLKVHEVVMEKDSKIYRGKKERIKSIALKAKKESSDDETLTSGSDDEEYAMAVRNFKKFFRRKGKFVRQPREEKKSFRQRDEKKGKSDRKCFRCGDPNHLIGDCPKPSRNKDQKAFIGGSWSDSENDAEDKTNDETCLMAQSSNEVTLNSSCYSDNASSLDNDNMQIEYDSLCEISLKIINKNKILKTKRDLLEKEILELNEKIKKLERSKEIEIACLGFDSGKASTSGTKTMSFVGSSAEKAMDGSTIKVHGSTLPGSVSRTYGEKGTKHVFSPPMSSRSDFVITRKKLIHNSIDESKKPSLKPSLKSGMLENLLGTE